MLRFNPLLTLVALSYQWLVVPVTSFSPILAPSLTVSPSSTTTSTRLAAANSLKPAAGPLMDAGKALARSGELLIDVTTALDLYGGALSATGAQVRNAGDALAQAAASLRFATALELVTDELREAGTCLQEASDKCTLAVAEAEQDDLVDLIPLLQQMQPCFKQSGLALEATGAGILQRTAVATIGQSLEEAATPLATIATLIPSLGKEPAPLSGQRLAFCADKIAEAGRELQGVSVSTNRNKGKGWIKGGR